MFYFQGGGCKGRGQIGGNGEMSRTLVDDVNPQRVNKKLKMEGLK